MSLRMFALVSLVLFGAFAVFGCGARDEGGTVSENELTAELVLQPATVVALPTATAEPTATPEPTAVVEPTVESRSVNIPNRGYNSYGGSGCADYDVRFLGLPLTALRDLAPRDGRPDA